jgi:hypothetical protein
VECRQGIGILTLIIRGPALDVESDVSQRVVVCRLSRAINPIRNTARPSTFGALHFPAVKHWHYKF